MTRAQAFLASGEYYWNSGMFLFRARRYLEELEKFAPGHRRGVPRSSFAGAMRDLDFTRIDAAASASAAANRSTMRSWRRPPMRWWCRSMPGWSDVGNWTSLHAACEHDEHGNALFGDVLVEDTHDSYVYSESRLVATVGLRDHVVVETKDAVLVAPKDRVQDVKKLVARIKADGRYEHSLHRRGIPALGQLRQHRHRRALSGQAPDGAVRAACCRCRCIIIAPNIGSWSPAPRASRAATRRFLLEENQSTYIPIGVRHRIENPGRIPLHIIEVQSGELPRRGRHRALRGPLWPPGHQYLAARD